MNLKGTYTALVTPFKNGKVDLEGLEKNVAFQFANGVSGVVALGTTGEAPTLSKEEQEAVVECARGKGFLIVGTGSYSTEETIAKTKRARALGADAALIVTPYYNKPSQEGIFRHFEAVSKSVDLPIIVYNIAGRCAVNVETSTLKRIAALPTVVAVKEASGNVLQAAEVRHALPDLTVLSGDDALTLPMMALGATGVISVVSNLVPKEMVALTTALIEGKLDVARALHERLFPLFRASFLEVNPVPIKEAMALCQMASGTPRLPLVEMHPDNKQRLCDVLQNLELIP